MSTATVNLVKKVVDQVLNGAASANTLGTMFDAKWQRLVAAGNKDRKSSFPDIKYKIESISDEGNQVALRYTATATHKGRFKELAATNKALSWEGTAVFTVKADKVIDIDVRENVGSKMIQLGHIPVPRPTFVPNATGVWTSSQAGVIVTLGLKQTAGKITGTVAVSGIPGENRVEGTVDGKSVAIAGAIGTARFKFSGAFNGPNRIVGQLSGAVTAPATLARS